MKKFFEIPPNGKARTAIFISGSGTNAIKILEFWQNNPDNCHFIPSCIVTDRPERCTARDIAERFNIPLIEHDIFSFYKSKGLKNISLATEAGREARSAWTQELIIKLEEYPLEFAIFAGFIPLCNITEKLPCLNVHPGDLTVVDVNNQRLLVGLHAIPIELAVINNIYHMRTTVIVASAYSSSGAGMDEGSIIGLSPEVDIDFKNKDITYYKDLYNKRQGKVDDPLRKMANENQEALKVDGDWLVFPPSVNDFASGRFAIDEKGQLHLDTNGNYLPIEYIEYSQNQKEIVFSE
jgi:folate-dependent phosphoribosylglycinamide formyltransferase PurN